MKKIQIALDFITLYKKHKTGSFYYPKNRNDGYPGKKREKVREGLKSK